MLRSVEYRHGPAHAGKLPGWERLVFGLLFALMAAFVVTATVSEAQSAQAGVPGSARLPGALLALGAAGHDAQHVLGGAFASRAGPAGT